jgi:four helix bundle protein
MVFALGVFRFVRPMLRDGETRHVAQQLLRSSTAVASNYRAACLARSHKEWTARIGVVREESDESLFWLTFLDRAGLCPGGGGALDPLRTEAQELARIFGASYRTSQHHRSTDRPPLDTK